MEKNIWPRTIKPETIHPHFKILISNYNIKTSRKLLQIIQKVNFFLKLQTLN